MDQRGSLMSAIAKGKGVDKKAVTPQMMSEFKEAVVRVLTPHASAILLDPEFGLNAAKQRAKNAGLLLAYEKSGYDNTQPGRLPDLLDHYSVRRIVDGARIASRSCSTTRHSIRSESTTIKHAWVERIGAECAACGVPFFLEFVGYEEGATKRASNSPARSPRCVTKSMEEFSQDRNTAWTCLKVEVPVNMDYVDGSSVVQGRKAYTREEAKEFP